MFSFGSIKWRLQLWHGVLLLAVTGTLLVAYHRSERREALARLDREHRLVLLVTLPELRPPGPPGANTQPAPPPLRASDLRDDEPDDDNQDNPSARSPSSGQPRSPILREFVRDGGFIIQRAPNRAPRVFAGEPPAGIDADLIALSREPGNGFLERQGYRILWHVRRSGDIVALGSSLAPINERLSSLAWRLAGGGGAVVLLGILAGAWFIGRALRPIDAIAATARRIADGSLSERIPLPPRGGELARLAAVLNDSFARVEHAFGQQARFTSDSSHELRTPISVLLTETQLALKRERSAAEYRESLVICCETTGKMKRLVDDLLLLARSDARALQANRAACDLSAIADSVRHLLEPLAEERGMRLRHSASPAPVQGDASQLERILVNLVMNAAQHSPAGAEIVIETGVEDRHSVARVIDHGRGIPPESLPHIFDRFYRVDPSRARTEGGAGLGLAISRGIAESHGGRIEATSEPGVRTVFTLRLPAA